MKTTLKNAANLLVATAILTCAVSEASAQTFRSGSSSPAPMNHPMQTAPQRADSADFSSGPSSSTTAGPQSDPDFVMLADYTPAGQTPRPARPSTIDGTTPMISRENYMRRYPGSGAAGYHRIALENWDLCNWGAAQMNKILRLDMGFASAEEEYVEMQRIYEGLSGTVKKATRIMTLAQAASTGALCLLSGGFYCIAAVAIGIGNLFSNQANKKLQLANIKLSLANIRLTRLNITSNRLTLSFDTFWLEKVLPKCTNLFPNMAAVLAGPDMPPMPAP